MENIFTVTADMQSCDIEATINNAPDGAHVIFEKGIYPLKKALFIKGRKGLVLEGSNAVLSPFFDRRVGADSGSGVFEFLDCDDLTVKGFTVCSPVPVNTAGRILDVTSEYADVEMISSVAIDGKEQFIDGGIFDEEMRPKNHYWVFAGYDAEKRTVIAGEIPCTSPRKLDTPHSLVGENIVRVFSQRLVAIEKGMRCCISHSYYGLCAFVFRQSRSVKIVDVKITNFAGFGFLILPHCRDFTFSRVRFASSDKEHQPLALNSDGIHMTGLSGKLVIDDCDFDCIGDDVLNVHTQVMTAKKIEENEIVLVYDKICGRVSSYWCEKGDLLRVYDPESLTLKGKIKVLSAKEGNICADKNGVEIKLGDYVTNDKYYPNVTVSNCRFYGWRTRIMCLQGAESVDIVGCRFENVSKKAIFCTSSFDYWMEAGPLNNVTIKDNLFRGIGEWYGADSVVFVGIDGKKHKDVAPIHKNVTVKDNRFENISGRCIEIRKTHGVLVENNTFSECPFGQDDIVIEECESVVCGKNKCE